MNAKFKQKMEDGRIAPDNNEEYLLYQTILGAWPWQMESQKTARDYVERIKQYASKALSEAKVNLSWINPDPEYMKAVHAFITAILMPGPRGKESPFVDSLVRSCRSYSYLGWSIRWHRWCLRSRFPGFPTFIKATSSGN